MVHVNAERPTAMEVDADRDATSVRILESHESVDLVDPDLMVSTAAVSH